MFGETQAAIFERLEVTKKFGLVADYHVSWSGRKGRLIPKVQVWGNGGTTEYVVQNYITQLLQGLVPAQQINVADDRLAN